MESLKEICQVETEWFEQKMKAEGSCGNGKCTKILNQLVLNDGIFERKLCKKMTAQLNGIAWIEHDFWTKYFQQNKTKMNENWQKKMS